MSKRLLLMLTLVLSPVPFACEDIAGVSSGRCRNESKCMGAVLSAASLKTIEEAGWTCSLLANIEGKQEHCCHRCTYTSAN